MNKRFSFHFCAAATLLAVAMMSQANAATDDFNRAILGANWTVQAGSFNLDAGRLSGTSGSLMTYGPGLGYQSASLDVFLDGTGNVQYGAIVLGYNGLNESAFIKIQNDFSDLGHPYFDSVGFYYGNNGSGGDIEFFSITGFEGVTAARISASLSGSLATLSIDSTFDGIPEATYSCDYGSGRAFGNGVGLGIYGNARLDNFTVPAVPEPSSLALGGLGLLAALLWRRR